MNERNDRTERVVAASVPAETSVSHLSWGSVIAGVVMSIVVVFTLMLLGLSIGLANINPATEENPFGGLGIGSAIWWVISSLIALFFGGWVAARMAGLQRQFDGAIHGLVMWGVYTLLTFYLLTTAIGAVVSGTFNVIGKVFSAGGHAIGKTAEKVMDFAGGDGQMMQEIAQKLPDLTEQEKQQAKDIGMKVVKGQGLSEADKQVLMGMLTRHTGVSQEEANRTVQEWEQKFQQASAALKEKVDQAKVKADQAASALAKASFWGFIMLLLGAAAAAGGGVVGRVKGPVRV